MRTIADEQADALQDEFPDFQVWVDFRSSEDGQPHWHARMPGWTPDKNLHAHDADGMRRELVTYTGKSSPEQQAPR